MIIVKPAVFQTTIRMTTPSAGQKLSSGLGALSIMPAPRSNCAKTPLSGLSSHIHNVEAAPKPITTGMK